MSKRALEETVECAQLPGELWTHIISLCARPTHWLVISKTWQASARDIHYRRLLTPLLWRDCELRSDLCNLSTLPHITDPAHLARTARVLFFSIPGRTPPSHALILGHWQLQNIAKLNRMATVPPPLHDGRWRLGHAYLLVLRDGEYWLMGSTVLKELFHHYGERKLTTNTTLSMLNLKRARDVRWMMLDDVVMPTPDPVRQCSRKPGRGEAMLSMSSDTLMDTLPSTWFAFIHSAADAGTVCHYLNHRYSMLERTRALGLELAATLCELL